MRIKPVRQALNLTRSLIWASSIRDGKRFVSNMIHNEESKVQRLGCPLIWAVGRVWLIAAPRCENLYSKKIMDTNTLGKITELEVMSYIIKKGYSVSVPFGDKDRYDQIWDINGKLLRIQIKTSHLYNKNTGKAIEFKTTGTSNGKTTIYTKDDIDYFATFWEGQVYVVPVEETSSKKVLRFEATINQPNICWAKNYTVEEILGI